MLRTVHGVYLVTIVIILYCGSSHCIQINREDAGNLDLESLQVLEPSITTKNDVEIIPEDDIDLLFTTVEAKRNQKEKFMNEAIIERPDKIKQRKIRQAAHGHSQLYPQLPSGPPYNSYQPQPPYNSPGQNPYQPQPPYNPPGQNPYQPQPPYNPPGQNPYQPQPPYNPPGQNPYQPQPPYNSPGHNPYQPQHSYTPPGQKPYQAQHSFTPFGQNTNAYNNSQSGNPPYNYNSNTGFQGSYQGTHNTTYTGSHYNPNTGFYKPNPPPFNPYTGQNPYGPQPSYPTYNSTSPGNSQRPSAGQYSSYNQSSNYPHNTASFRPPNATGFSTPYPAYNPRPGVSLNNNSNSGQPLHNNFYPPTSGNTHPVINFNSSSQRPPYYNPNQYPSNPHPNQPRWPNANSSYPNYPRGPSPSYNISNSNYPHGPPHPPPYSPQPPQNSPYYPGTRSQYPNIKPNYPSSNSSAGFADTYYNPSVPNYPPHNNNHGENNFNYPQRENTEYDPRRVPPQNFSYH